MKAFREIEGCALALGKYTVGTALAELRWHRPTLHVHESQVALGYEIVHAFDMNLQTFNDLGAGCWYVEWNGQKVGSCGY